MKLKGAVSENLHQLEGMSYSGDQSVYTGITGIYLEFLNIEVYLLHRHCSTSLAGSISTSSRHSSCSCAIPTKCPAPPTTVPKATQ